MLYRDEAIVLRTHKLGEADRIITLLTRQHGLVRAVAKGVRRTTSRFGSRLEPFTHVDLQLAEGRNLDTVTQAETLTPFSKGLGLDYDRYTAGTVMLETADRLVAEERQPSLQQFLLLVGGLRAMVAGEHGPGQVLDSYLLRSLSVAGYAPSFEQCVRAVRRLGGPHRWFNPSMGGVLCATCRVPGSASPAPETVALLGALLAGDWDVVHAAHPRHLKEASSPGGGVPRLAPRARPQVARLRRALSRETRRPPAHAAPVRGAARPRPEGPGAPARRDRDGRQRPLGQGARPAAHPRARAGRALALRRRRGRDRDRREGHLGLRVLHRELVALARGGASS